jgi:predicted enzyme related to lactoylglutathione lyase
LEPKIKKAQGGAAAMMMVASGEAEIGFTFLSEMDEPRLDIVGPLPREIAPPTTLVGFVSAHAKNPTAAKALVDFLASSAAAAVYKAQHMEPAPAIIGAGNFSHIVENLDRSIAFYRDVIGLELTGNPRPFDPNPAIMKMGNTIGAQSRVAVLKVPGFDMGLELIEYKDIDRKPAHPRFQDPGAANLAVRLKDLDTVVARLKKSDAHILTAGQTPAAVNGRSRYLFIQDPDGFVLELTQPDPLPSTAAQAAGNVIGGGVEVCAEDAAKTAAFYRDALGFQPNEPSAYNGDKVMTDTAGTPGAEFRQSRAQIPGMSVNLTWIEFRKIDRKPLRTRVQDPGTALVQLRVRNLDALLPKIKAGGGTIVSVGEQPVQIGTFGRIAIARDPNNFFLELIERAE